VNISAVKDRSDLPSDEGPTAYESSYRWVMLGLLWLLYASFGIISRAISPLVTPILRDLNMSYGQMGFILGAWQLTYIAVAIIGGTIIDRWGVRKSIFAGILVIALSSILRYFPHGFGTMLFAVVLFGVGGPMISIGCPKTVSVWFRGRSRGTAIGITTTAPWVGGLLAFSLTNSFVMPLTGYSWRLTFVYYGLIACVFALVWLLLAREAKPATTTESAGITGVFVKLLKSRKVQIVLIMGLLTFAVNHGLGSWLPKILETSGLSPAAAGYAASIPTAIGIPAILIVPHIVAPHLRGLIVALFALLAAAAVMAIVTTSGFLFLAGLVLFGITASSFMPLMILLLMDSSEVEAKYMGSAGGLFFCVAEIGGFGGPMIIGALVDITSTFLAGAIFLASALIAIFALALLLRAQSGHTAHIDR
jgi:sugar phosphate permease